MAYSESIPPRLISPSIGSANGNLWMYVSADAIATVDGADYFTSVDDIGMVTNDVVLVVDTTNDLSTIGKMTVAADGDGTLTALTAVP